MKKATIVKSKFIRSIGLDRPNTKLWDTFNAIIKFTVNNKIKLIPDEKVVVIFFPDDTYWWLITNARFILFENNKIKYVDNESIFSMEDQFVKYLRNTEIYEGFTINLKGEEGKRRFLKQEKAILLLTLKNKKQIDVRFDPRINGCIISMLRFIFN